MNGPACALCGTPCRPPFRAPAPEQPPDLDLRPGEPARSTLSRWVQTCGGCGAAAPDLAGLPPAARETVESLPYETLASEVPAALGFLRWAAICHAAGDDDAAAEALLHAAWAADDAGADAEAVAHRLEAARMLGEPEDAETALRLVDILRRAGEFTEAHAVADGPMLSELDENSAAILAFQRARIADSDAARHTLSGPLRPPAHTPHVLHGRRRDPQAFWRKLFGG